MSMTDLKKPVTRKEQDRLWNELTPEWWTEELKQRAEAKPLIYRPFDTVLGKEIGQ